MSAQSRNGFRFLLLATVLAVSLALYGFWREEQRHQTAEPEILLPSLTKAIPNITRVELNKLRGMNNIERVFLVRHKRQWLVENQFQYPAQQQLVNQFIIQLAQIVTLEKRSESPKWHHALGVTAAEDLGRAMRIKLFDADGKEMFHLLLGRQEESEFEQVQFDNGLAPQADNFYVRHADQNIVWLARGRIPQNLFIGAWVSQTLPEIRREQIAGFSMNGKPARFAHSVERTAWLEIYNQTRFQEVSRAAIEGVSPRNFDIHLKNGLTIRIHNYGMVNYLVTGFSFLLSDDADEMTRLQADLLRQRYDGWLYRFPVEAAAAFLPNIK